MNTSDDAWLIKYKQVGLSDKVIAQKLGVPLEEIQQRWKDLMDQSARLNQAGYDNLAAQYHTLCGQYQLMGESLKLVAMALSDVAPIDEIRMAIVSDPEKTLMNLTQSFIILRPCRQVDPSIALEESLKRTQAGN